MHITIQREALIQAVQDVAKAVSSRTTIPILTGIKLEAHGDGMTLTGSDTEISIERTIYAEENGTSYVTIHRAGSVVLNARFFGDIVKKMPKDEVTLEVSPNFMTRIQSGTAEFHLNGLDPDEFPRLPQVDGGQRFRLPADLLRSMIRQTSFAVAVQETRPVLTGVNFSADKGILTCVSTDSHRLALRRAQFETDTDISFQNVIVPGKSLNELSKLLGDGHVDITITNQQILFKMKHVLFFSRLLDGNYPDTSRLIPEEYRTAVRMNAKELLQAIDRASLLAREDRNNVIKFAAEGTTAVEISSHSPEVGKVSEQVSILSLEGEELKISFNSKYMMDALKALDATDIEIQFTGSIRPFILHPVDQDNVLQLILPVRTA
ncbi:DNA polymerase III subunit beta [Exiguobacterium acetylicum]|uniref:DNA polymerase III subunit beta n=1 Tax=Exiguobacterium acetylicum TaxID=41170 RepID=UPI001EE19681|nr:DNA polymerase III subunit beta [Exiguobacterium acetylicum]UKS56100.1 DNA polymerase III subunit beta [Exiguobacterium acetylicum]